MAERSLERFIHAQIDRYEEACGELQSGKKTGHWMWFVFPQLLGLGRSSISIQFGVSSLSEARAYLQHPVLGARLRHAVNLVMSIDGKSLREIFGSPDDLKFCSSMTLFAQAAKDEDIFLAALAKYGGGVLDERTLKLLHKE